jgi:predicted outer membrane repeat protein
MTRSVRIPLVLLLPALALLAASTATATTFTVANTNDDGAGSLRQAIRDANADNTATAEAQHTITFAQGVTGSITLQSRLDALNNHIMITGPGTTMLSVLRGVDSLFPIFIVPAGKTVKITGLSILNGSDTTSPAGGGGGGGIRTAGKLTIEYCVFTGNSHLERGGAISNSSILTVSNTTFADNTSNRGGAIYNFETGIVTLNQCEFANNSASVGDSLLSVGGAIVNDGTLNVNFATFTLNGNRTTRGGAIANYGDATLNVCSFSKNWVFDEGASIYNNTNGSINADSCMFTKDTAGYAACIATYGEFTGTFCVFSDSRATESNAGAVGGSGTMTFTNCIFSNNSAMNGGAIESYGGLTINGSIFSANRATGNGGAVENFGGMAVTNCTFNNNTAADGGAISIRDFARLTVTTSSFTSNSATNNGGGITTASTVTMVGCDMTGGSANNGGGIYSTSTVTVSNSTIYNNDAANDGGGIHNSNSLTLTNATIVANTAVNRGGNVFNFGTVMPINTILAQGTSGLGPDFFGNVFTQGNNIVGDIASSTSWGEKDQTGSTATPIDVKLGPFQVNGGSTRTMELLAGSPAVNSGNDTVLTDPYNLTTDQRGTPRKVGVRVDIGAYESSFLEAGLPVEGPGTTLTPAIAMHLFPNPASREFQISYTLATPAAVTLDLYAMDGARVAVVLDGAQRETGDHSEQINVSTLTPGTYTLQLTTSTGRSVQRIVVVE